VLIDVKFIKMHVIYMCMLLRGSVTRPVDGPFVWVALSELVVQDKVFRSSIVQQWCCWPGMLQFGIRAKVSTLSLDGLDKWSLEPRFPVEIVSRGTNFEPQNDPECQEVTLVMLRSSGGVAVL
jgi:hypothetical protein